MAGTKLGYTVATVPFPLEAGATELARIQVIGENPLPNPTGEPVVIQAIEIKVPIGAASSDLTGDATGIEVIPPSREWTLVSNTPAGVYSFEAPNGSFRVTTKSLLFELRNVSVNDQPGYVEGFEVIEAAGNCKSDCPAAPLALTKYTAGSGKVSFTADPSNIRTGQSTTLSWSGPVGATYEIEFSTPQGVVRETLPSNDGSYPGAGKPPLEPLQTTVFTLTMTLSGYGIQVQRVVTVTPVPEILEFAGTIAATASGYQATVQWNASNADYCTLGDDPTELSTQGQKTVALEAPWIEPLVLNAFVKDDPTTASSTLTVEWAMVGSTTLPPCAEDEAPTAMAASLDGGLIWVARRKSIAQLKAPQSPSGGLEMELEVLEDERYIPSGMTAVSVPAGGILATRWPGPAGFWLALLSLPPTGRAKYEPYREIDPMNEDTEPKRHRPVATTPDGPTAYVSDGYANLYAVNLTDPDKGYAWTAELQGYGSIAGLAVGTDGTLYVAAGKCAFIFSAEGPSTTASLPAAALDLSIAGDVVFALVEGGRIVPLDSSTMQQLGSPFDISGERLAASPDGMRLYVVSDQAIVSVIAPKLLSGGMPSCPS